MIFRKKAAGADDPVTPKKAKKQKVITTKNVAHDFVKAAKEFEVSRIGEIERSRVLAWRVAIGACCTAIASALAIVMMMPLKQIQPYVIRVDNNTGATDIVTALDGTKTLKTTEAEAKYFAALYVRLVEGYDWYTIENQLNQAMIFSDAAMQNRLTTKFEKPDAPHKVYQDQSRVEVKINNVSFISENNLLQVRFTTTVVPNNGGNFNPQTQQIDPTPVTKKWIATMGYDFVNVPTLDEVRLINPLGFQVKSYRVDEDASL